MLENESGYFWKPIALQVDPLDRFGHMTFPDPTGYLDQSLESEDRFALDVQQFGSRRFQAGERLPCQAQQGVELRHKNRYGYLFVCDAKRRLPSMNSPIQYEPKAGRLQSHRFFYQHEAKNHLMFQKIGIIQDGKGREVGSNSNQLIYADIKNFLNLAFDADDVEAKLQHIRFGPMGLVALLQFYLSVFAFKIELSLTPEVQFFADSLYMPMSLFSPVNAADYLGPASAVYYSWDSAAEVSWGWQSSHLPSTDSPRPLSLGDYCTGLSCSFRLSGQLDKDHFTMKFVIPYRLAKLGFFPSLVSDIEREEALIGRSLAPSGHKNRIVLKFRTDRLPEGNHDWDFWVYFGDPGRSCPAPLWLRPLPSRNK